MAISRAASQAAAAEQAMIDEAVKKRAARQAAALMIDPTPPEMVTCRVLKKGDGRISMGIHVAGVGDAFYEHKETFKTERSIATELEDRGFVEIEGDPKDDD